MSWKDPALFNYFLKTLSWQQRAACVRRAGWKKGVPVPAVLIISVTNQCNLHCVGCYARALHRPAGKEMSLTRLHQVIKEARDLGVSIIFLAGGEPLIRPGLLAVAKNFPDVIFPLFTNGTLIDDIRIKELKRARNVFPILSLEGNREETDDRRGAGVYETLRRTIRRLQDRGIFWGISFTVTRLNFSMVINEQYIRGFNAEGCKTFFFVEYVPVRADTEGLVLTEDQKATMIRSVSGFRDRLSGLFIMFPGDEEEFDGCLSSGRGFVHVNAQGRLEPCPFAPYSDVSLEDMPLRDALRSDLLKKIREHHRELRETVGGCALWARHDWVRGRIG